MNNSYSRVTEILRTAGLIDFSGVPPDVLEASRQFGSAVHKMIELWHENTLDEKSLDPNLVSYLNAWKCVWADFIHVGSCAWTEKPLESKKHKFRGTPDAILKIEDRFELFEIKTSARLETWVAIQTAGYEILHNENYPKYKIHRRYGVRLCPEKSPPYEIKQYKDKSDLAGFLHCLYVCNLKKRMGI
jgi:hypothetical protein